MQEQILRRRAIFLDDDLSLLEAIKDWLAGLNLPGYVTSSIKNALHWVEQAVANIFICDLRMPGQDGVSVIQQVRKIDPDIELAILTGYELTDKEKNIVKELDAKVYLKYNLQGLLDSLVSPYASKKEPSMAMQLQTKIAKLEYLNRTWARYLIDELNKIEGLENARVFSSETSFSVKELIDDIETLNPRGIEHIKLWLDAQERIRQMKK